MQLGIVIMFSIFGRSGLAGMNRILPKSLDLFGARKAYKTKGFYALVLIFSLITFFPQNASSQCKKATSSCNLTSITGAFTPTATFLGCASDSCNLYYLLPNAVTADSAEKWAANLGAHLTSIHSQAENDSITKWAASKGITGSVWIGLNDKATNGRFVWTDETDTLFKNWKSGRPNGIGANDDCVQLFVTGSDSGKWNDTVCSMNLPAVIKVSLCMSLTNTNDTVCKNDSASISVSAKQGSSNYSYAWSNSGTTDTISLSPSASTFIKVTVTDRYSCTAIDSSFIQIDTLPSFSLGTTDTICADSNKVLDAGAGLFKYLWSSGKTGQTDTVIFAGKYWGQKTDSNGCSFTDTFSLVVDSIPVFNLGNDTTVCAGDTAIIKPNETNSTYSYVWQDNTTGSVYKTDTTISLTLKATDLRGCSSSSNRKVTKVALPVINIGSDTSVCAGSIFILNGPNAFNYHQWIIYQDTLINASTTVDTNGSYFYFGRDTNNCPAFDTVKVLWDTIPVINIGNDTSICQFDSITLQVGSGYKSIYWTNGDTTESTKVSNPQSYSVIVSDSNGCGTSDFIKVDNDTLPIVNLKRNGISSDTNICIMDSVFLHNYLTDTNLFYKWNGGLFVKGNDSLIVKTASTNSLTIRDSNTCINMDSIKVGIDTLPIVNITADSTICKNDSILIRVNPDTNFTKIWGGINLGTLDSMWVKKDTTYYVTLINKTTTCRANDSVAIMHDTLPNISLGIDTGFCDGDSIIMDAGANYQSYLWSSATTDTLQKLTVKASGSYSVNVVDKNGCKGSDTKVVAKFLLPIPNLGPDKEFCAGTPINEVLDPGAGYSNYNWFNGPNGDSTVARKYTVTAQGTYSVIVTDSNRCNGHDTIVINANFLPTVSLGADTAFCSGDKFNFLANAGPGFVKYEWFEVKTGAPVILPTTGQILLVKDTASTIRVRITDINGCQNTDEVKISEIPLPVVVFAKTKYCESAQRFFSEELDANPANDPSYISFVWSTGDSTRKITVTKGDDYLVTVTNVLGCSNIGKKEVIEISKPNIDWSGDTLLCSGASINLDAQKPGYVHYWWYKVFDVAGKDDSLMNTIVMTPTDTFPDTTITSQLITQPGKYQVFTRYFESPFCYDSTEVSIREDLFPKIDFGIQTPDTTLCVGETLLLNPNFYGSSSLEVKYLWQNDSEDSVLNARTTGLYTLTLTNDCGADIDEVYARFEDCSQMWIPNSFTPNGDGDNELWGVTSLESFLTFKLEVFDRTGHVIWETNNSDVSWDGTHFKTGEPLPIGVYIYRISYRSNYDFIDNVNSAPTKELRGAIHLIR